MLVKAHLVGVAGTLMLFTVAASPQATAQTQVGQPITYDQILQNPDDLRLSFAYARQEASKGNLQQSAGSLERLLLLEPEWDAARLFYAIVLYRLDDMDGAVRELAILRTRDLTADQRREVERYYHLATTRNAPTRLFGEWTFGFRHDTNPNLAPDGSTILFEDVPVDNEIDKDPDTAFYTSGRARLEHSLGTGNGDFLFFDTRGWLNEQFSFDKQDYISGRVRAGGTFFFGPFSVSPAGIYTGLTLDGDHYLDEFGGELEIGFAVSPHLALKAEVIAVDQDYYKTSLSNVGSARDGLRLDAGGGFSWRPVQWNIFSLEAYYVDKEADDASFAFDGPWGRASNLTLLGKGTYLLSQLTLWNFTYDAPDPRYSSTIIREDFRLKAKLAYGTPLQTVADLFEAELPPTLGDMNFQISGSYTYQDSTIKNLDFENWSVEGLFTKRFSF
ncbi:hypothetical protein [Rhodoligotrophos defluvii]|uniref:hypothetical protein n=1 Tax=Rhodoligotrophos defluvii TaxID=2561934 RepID=UPI0010C97009|nr:hypothetical protein [Rhodoligotrophos defluvii]